MMKPAVLNLGGVLDIYYVNSKSSDPVVYVFHRSSGDACLLDLGDISGLSHKNLLRVKKIFITHTHIDHFIGFDRLLRVHIPHRRHLEFVGPEGITENISSKLRGYLWNLLEEDQICYRVIEMTTKGKRIISELNSSNQFSPKVLKTDLISQKSSRSPMQVSEFSDQLIVEAAWVDHGVPILAYALQAKPFFRVEVEKLKERFLLPGSWIREAQEALKEDRLMSVVPIHRQEVLVKDLFAWGIFTRHAPKYLSYLTDTVYNKENVKNILGLIYKSRFFICETAFSNDDSARAKRKKHLTIKQGAHIAAMGAVETADNFHFSNIYGKNIDHLFETNFQKEFSKYKLKI